MRNRKIILAGLLALATPTAASAEAPFFAGSCFGNIAASGPHGSGMGAFLEFIRFFFQASGTTCEVGPYG